MDRKRLALAVILFLVAIGALLRAAYPVTFGWLGFIPLAWAPFLLDGLLLLGFLSFVSGAAADRDFGLTLSVAFFLYVALGAGIRFAGGATQGSLPASIEGWFLAIFTWPSWLAGYVFPGIWPG